MVKTLKIFKNVQVYNALLQIISNFPGNVEKSKQRDKDTRELKHLQFINFLFCSSTKLFIQKPPLEATIECFKIY